MSSKPPKLSFFQDFRRFFVRGLAALLPTLITLWVLIKVWGFLWESLGQYMIKLVELADDRKVLPSTQAEQIRAMDLPPWAIELTGVLLAILLVYIVGLLVGNLIGRTMWRLAERLVMRIPVVRAVYPAVKQVTDYLLSDQRTQFSGSRVVAVRPHDNGIWSIGLVTGPGIKSVTEKIGQETVTVFIPSSPTAFSGYVLVVPRSEVVDLPIKVEEAMRLLISGGVLSHGPTTGPVSIGGSLPAK